MCLWPFSVHNQDKLFVHSHPYFILLLTDFAVNIVLVNYIENINIVHPVQYYL